ncbi:methyltransferase [Nocardioides sp. CFH 31398]|uniref:methyltransferase n=1 Tax=Nocardioides sp. CFH 31398 TaxID=2919579 RepID=UPI001F06257D|nr:methyltransferase [Nocardioides sp. CFH 31398]MCH1868077.1 methyltransferase domain-containing protein [Nocardioides sp. CFH 31398]
MPGTSTARRARGLYDLARRQVASAIAGRGPEQSPERRAADAAAYWRAGDDERWSSNSHFRDSEAFSDAGSLWERMGREHLDLVRTAARAAGWTWDAPRVVDWGCGGGANAAAVAPHAGELVLVDLSARTLAEAAAQVAAVADVPTTQVVVDVDAPEAALDRVAGCDLFLCFYVLELVPSQEHGARILRVAAEALAPGGMAVLQFKYDDGRPTSRPHRRDYVRHLADMTTYGIADFWTLVEACGLRPVLVTLVPENELDQRYGYLAAVKP